MKKVEDFLWFYVPLLRLMGVTNKKMLETKLFFRHNAALDGCLFQDEVESDIELIKSLLEAQNVAQNQGNSSN